jgi:hypothetical protein
MLIFKGREELEVYLTLHKQRHHAVGGGPRRWLGSWRADRAGGGATAAPRPPLPPH